jgi:glycosyltransferase involved in cell wall biosynthesis
MRVRVLFLSPVPDFKGGAEQSLFDLVDNPGVEPLLVVPAAGAVSAHATSRDVPVRVLDFGSIGDVRRPFRFSQGIRVIGQLLRVARQLVEICRRGRVDIVHSNGLKAHVVAVTARLLGGAPCVIHIRDIANTRAERIVWKLLQLLSDQMILVSRACWPSPRLPRNVYVVYNGVRLPAAERPAPRGSALVLGFIGRIHPAKGLHVLISWLAHARRRGLALRLVVRGVFAKETPDYEREIAEQIRALELAGQVAFEGFVADPDGVYAGIDVVCVPSTAPDPLPRSVMEAMGRGLVVVAAPCGGIPEMITHGENGFLIEDPRDFAATMQRLQSKPQLLGEIGRKARDRCVCAFTLERLHEGVDRVYARAARKHAAHPPGRIGVHGMQEPRADLPVGVGKHPV